MKTATKLAMAAVLATVAPLAAQEQEMDMEMMADGLVMPEMDSVAGRELFVSTGCVACHSINGVGGMDGPPLDAEFMPTPMNPFEFAARMWFGAARMIELQEDELGGQIYLSGEDLANIIAFVHDADEQAGFSEEEIPEEIAELMHHGDEEDDGHGDEEEDDHDDEEEDDHDDEEEDDDHDDDEDDHD